MVCDMAENMHVRLVHLMKLLRFIMQDATQDIGIGENEIMALHFFAFSGQDTAKALVGHRGVSRSLASKTIDNLVREGYLLPRKSKTDRRIVHLLLTPKAEALVERIAAQQNQINGWLTEGLTLEEEQLFLSVLDRMLENTKKRMKKGEQA